MTKSETIPNLELAGDGATASRPAADQSSSVNRHSSLPSGVPTISKPLLRLFTWYSRRLLRRNFHSLRVSLRGMPPPASGVPTVIYSNHASWWDPLVALMLAEEFFRNNDMFGPMDAKALEKHAFFKKLGVFGVELESFRGAKNFLRTARAILAQRGSVLWMTPQGRFADARERPVHFKPGIGHLTGLRERIRFVPVAIEYTFWEERRPEILVRFGQKIELAQHDLKHAAAACTGFFERQLAETQDALALEVTRRDPSEFRCLLRGRAGVGGVYDAWRRLKAAWRGEGFNPQHGRL
ncbi:MAG TPA: lysophospholipid acyltransferase family protein [Verrucomicrobiota bacterium]|nr:lysophospholipid acyltransferase family protein [Verrucomicrobiota bacterium]